MIEWKISNNLIDYNDAISFMETRIDSIYNGSGQELVWLLEHNNIYTKGTSAAENEFLGNTSFPVYQTGRGGKYTYHGPGQRIAYIMLDLKKRYYPNTPDLKSYIWNLEEWLIKSLDFLGIKGERRQNRIGIWVNTEMGEKKIAAIGVRVRKWITYHGIALNINPNLSNYNSIIPCGISEYGVTSLAELGCSVNKTQIDDILKKTFSDVF